MCISRSHRPSSFLSSHAPSKELSQWNSLTTAESFRAGLLSIRGLKTLKGICMSAEHPQGWKPTSNAHMSQDGPSHSTLIAITWLAYKRSLLTCEWAGVWFNLTGHGKSQSQPPRLLLGVWFRGRGLCALLIKHRELTGQVCNLISSALHLDTLLCLNKVNIRASI